MTKSIDTLIPDIYSWLEKKGFVSLTEAAATEFASNIVKRFKEREENEGRAPTLRLSRLGPQCPKALWSSIHTPELAERLPPWVIMKFSYGDLIEALVLALAKATGHNVQGEQDEVRLDGIVGHRDGVIDGMVVDVKSASSRSFLKFKDGSIKGNDPFGYLDQLDGYVIGSSMDPLVQVKDQGCLLAVDKQLGHLQLYKHEVTHGREIDLRARIAQYKLIVADNVPPSCECRTIPHQSSGNLQLDTKASYSPWKYCCFPNLRTFLYANGPVYLTKVARKPDVPEVNRYGQIVY